MTNQHPITPPSELVTKWWSKCTATSDNLIGQLATQAARWGADQELEACCEWVRVTNHIGFDGHEELRAARRPKSPSLKEQALALLQPGEPRLFNSEMQDTIRRALEALPND